MLRLKKLHFFCQTLHTKQELFKIHLTLLTFFSRNLKALLRLSEDKKNYFLVDYGKNKT